MRTVAALYVDPKGPYAGLDGVDAWGIERDARKYQGPYSVVAHPPCNLWVNFAFLNHKRWGGEHNRPGNDGGCFASALTSVRRFGGILEHPASSNAWSAYHLLRPEFGQWIQSKPGEWVTEVWQSAYGHPARKRTWLLYCGKNQPKKLRWKKIIGTMQIGRFDVIKPVLAKRRASLTPHCFANLLVELARNCNKGK